MSASNEICLPRYEGRDDDEGKWVAGYFCAGVERCDVHSKSIPVLKSSNFLSMTRVALGSFAKQHAIVVL